MFTTTVPPHQGNRQKKVVNRLQKLIHQSPLKPGDQLPPERDLAKQLGVSRPTLRSAICTLAATGVINSKQRTGNFVAYPRDNSSAEVPPEPIQTWIYGFTSEEIFDAQMTIEMDAAGLAAERASSGHLLEMIEEIIDMFANLDDPQKFLAHEVRFHQTIAAASGNRILAGLLDAVYSDLFKQPDKRVRQIKDLKKAAEFQQQIYQGIRDRNPEAARQIMREHLLREKESFIFQINQFLRTDF
jgi:GntR family transcriptional repressor for pyruvate dehydrogenase complex